MGFRDKVPIRSEVAGEEEKWMAVLVDFEKWW
jgi:hypothetical protein